LRRIPAEDLFPGKPHLRRCLCVSCGTKKHPDDCECWACRSRRYWEDEYRLRMERAERASVVSDTAARHVKALGLTRREVVERLRCSLSMAQRVSTPGQFISRRLERRVLEL